ncbi:RNA-dependent RNA polymerase family protein [Prunus dulcis]|uniref:RNA-dependent RNA polymerase family protein n=1 Tax=Prunus dulcis TaxID=3755 RepID=A0A4Y1QP12_PRUDU|nr:RNA-dependent RNA polymerase family protein [Prunus dulcis]
MIGHILAGRSLLRPLMTTGSYQNDRAFSSFQPQPAPADTAAVSPKMEKKPRVSSELLRRRSPSSATDFDERGMVIILGNFQFLGRLCRNFDKKSRSLVSGPGIGVMSGIPQDSSRVSGNSGRVLSIGIRALGSISCGPCTLCASLSRGHYNGFHLEWHICDVGNVTKVKLFHKGKYRREILLDELHGSDGVVSSTRKGSELSFLSEDVITSAREKKEVEVELELYHRQRLSQKFNCEQEPEVLHRRDLYVQFEQLKYK